MAKKIERSVMLDLDAYKALNHIAKEKDVSVSYLIRCAVKEYLNMNRTNVCGIMQP